MRTVSPTSSEPQGIALSPALRTSPFMRSTDDARVALLSRLIDHAPLFPPASLDLPDAVAEDRRASAHASSFMLARFVCPASRLSELPDIGRGVSVVLDTPETEVWLKPDPRIEALETSAEAGLAALVGRAPEVYVEVPLDDTLADRLDQLAVLGLRAKVRCGGSVTPSVDQLAGFLRACAERDVVFKATAGLHHALPSDGEHGFLNLLAATVFGDEEEALAESDPEAFTLDSAAFSWRGRHAHLDELAPARSERLHSIGSCSFFEPVEELEQLGILPL